MKQYHLTSDISPDSVRQIFRCFQPKLREFSSGEIVFRYSEKKPYMGLLTEGTAALRMGDMDGSSALVETYEKGDLFGELFHLPLDGFEYTVETEKGCSVLFISSDHVIHPCEKLCDHHSRLIRNLFLMAAQHSRSLSLHLNILSQPTIRKKLLAYLTCLRGQTGENPVTVPLTLSALAEYLCVDRSAMTREIRLMNQEGIIRSSRRQFFLLTDKGD